MLEGKLNAEVISVYPNRVKISVDDLESFKIAEERLKVGSYLRVSDNDNVILIAIIENFSIEVNDSGHRNYLIEANPMGIIKDGKFIRGADSLAIPPKKVEPAKIDEINSIYANSIKAEEKFVFSSLATNTEIKVPVNGNKFFNKHIAVIGSTGSGKSHTVATIIQKATKEKSGEYTGLNNSHIVIFDIHDEFREAFPEAKIISIDDLILPYWLLNSEEMEEIFLESGDRNNYNQASVLRTVITENKKIKNPDAKKVFFDSPLKFDITEVLNCLINLQNETWTSDNNTEIQFESETKSFEFFENKLQYYFTKQFRFNSTQRASKDKVGISKGTYADGTLDKFVSRFQAKINQDRLEFLFGEKAKNMEFIDVIKQFIGYEVDNCCNVTILDLSGVPFEVLSITVSLISRILFEFGYYIKRSTIKKNSMSKINNETPILLVYEEAHKYVPKSDLARYRASKNSIERIAKEGRKYGVSLLLSSQRPSEISETIFSQCNSFIAMRLSNPDDQNYVKRLLPDTLGSLTDQLPSLQVGEALLIGDAVILPSIVKIDVCEFPPSSYDIPYLELWKNSWKNIDFASLKNEWCGVKKGNN